MADATLRFLSDTAFQVETRRKAYQYAKPMFWPNVGQQYLDFFDQVAAEHQMSRRWLDRKVFPAPSDRRQSSELVPGGR